MEEEKNNQTKRGGKREGAGRKKKAEGGQYHVAFRCSQDVYDILCLQPNKTVYIEKAIREKWKREHW